MRKRVGSNPTLRNFFGFTFTEGFMNRVILKKMNCPKQIKKNGGRLTHL